MKTEFDKWYLNFDDGSFNATEMAVYSWRFGRENLIKKVLEVLKSNKLAYYELTNGGQIEEIEKL